MSGFVPGLAIRSYQPELLDTETVPDHMLAQAYRELASVNRWLGFTNAVINLLRQDLPVSGPFRVLDIGCGQGALLIEIQKKLNAQVIGVDLRTPPNNVPITILRADAVHDALPKADAAVSVLMAHHLSEDQLMQMIRNVEKSSRRLIILDLVRHPVPLWLFRIFVAPFLCRINAADGQTSIRRAYTRAELNSLVHKALKSSPKQVSIRHTQAPFWTSQLVDIRWT